MRCRRCRSRVFFLLINYLDPHYRPHTHGHLCLLYTGLSLPTTLVGLSLPARCRASVLAHCRTFVPTAVGLSCVARLDVGLPYNTATQWGTRHSYDEKRKTR